MQFTSEPNFIVFILTFILIFFNFLYPSKGFLRQGIANLFFIVGMGGKEQVQLIVKRVFIISFKILKYEKQVI